MKASARLPVVLFLVACAIGSPAPAQPAAPGEAEASATPGVRLAEALSTATGIAITPMLGVSAVGAWRWWQASAAEREALDWFCSPWVWGPGLFFTLLLLLKEPVLGAAPPLKKPLDALEVVESKVSALVATPAVVPMFLGAFGSAAAVSSLAGSLPVPMAAVGGETMAAPVAILVYTLAGVLFVGAFLVVWLAFHAVNVLILLSPFGFLDLFLRLIKFGALAVLLVATWISPWLGAAVAAAILVVSIPIAGWSLRLTSFGSIVAWDLLTGRHRRLGADGAAGADGPVVAFTAGRTHGIPTRAVGRLEAGDGRLSFRYRPWLVLRSRSIDLGSVPNRLERALVCPQIRETASGDRGDVLFRLPPRYRGHEPRVATSLGCAEVIDAPVLRGVKSVFAWMRESIGTGAGALARRVGAAD